MKIKSIQTLAVLLFTFITFNSWGQMFDRERQGEFPWKISAGFNAIDYSFATIKGEFKSVHFNMQPYPTRFSIERIIHRSLSFEFAYSYNVLKKGTQFNNNETPLPADWKYNSYDANLKLHFKNLIYIHQKFDPYINGGLGYNTLNDQSKVNIAGGGGFNYWPWMNTDCYCQDRFTDRIGFYLQAQGKMNVTNPRGDHHAQYSFGMIYKFK